MNEHCLICLLFIAWLSTVALAANNARYESDCYNRVDRLILVTVIFFPLNLFLLVLGILMKLIIHQVEGFLVNIGILSLYGFVPLIPSLLFCKGDCSQPPPVYTNYVRWGLSVLFSLASVAVTIPVAHLIAGRFDRRRRTRTNIVVSVRKAAESRLPEDLKLAYAAVSRSIGSKNFPLLSLRILLYIQLRSQRSEKNAGQPCRVCGIALTGTDLNVRTCCTEYNHWKCIYTAYPLAERSCQLCRLQLYEFFGQEMK